MVRAADYGLPEHVACPFCAGLKTELHSPFGTALSVATYWCNQCRTPFEWVKWGGSTGQSSPPSIS
jgi:3-hydroxybutyryl-CoA dehydrogenase